MAGSADNTGRRHGIARTLSKLGLASRTVAAGWVLAGRVAVNGRIVHDPEFPVRKDRDRLTVDGRTVIASERVSERVYLMLNKPRGLVTTAADERGRATVYRCFDGAGLPWVGPIGRLDKASEGLLLFSNDSEWAARITDPVTGPDKVYRVQVDTRPTPELLARLVTGVELGRERLAARSARLLRTGEKNAWLEIVLAEGRNRQIRRLLDAEQVSVLRLIRVAIGGLVLGDLPKGRWRRLEPGELSKVLSRQVALVVTSLLEVLHEDAELLAINKPADLVCHPSKDGELSSLIGRVRLHLGGGCHPHLVNRLDRETSGVTIVAKTDEAARKLRQLWGQRRVLKEYLAITTGHVRDDRGLIDAALGKDEHSRVAIKDCVREDGASAQTEFEVLRRFTRAGASFTLLRVVPRTGRKHQIRIHLAHLGHAIVGDKIYGADEDAYLALVEDRLTPEQRATLIVPNHALHARVVRFDWHGRPTEYSCEPAPWFADFSLNEFQTVSTPGTPPS